MLFWQKNITVFTVKNNIRKTLILFKFNWLIYVFITISAVSCVTEIKVPISTQIAKGPVVKLLLSPDSTLIAYCSKVVDVTSPFYQETNARVTLKTQFQQLPETFSLLAPGQYILKSSLQPKDSFYFNYQTTEDTFSVIGKLPTSINISKVDTSMQLIPGIGYTQSFTIHFKDSAIYSNFYRLFVIQTIKKYNLDASGKILDSTIISEKMKIDGTELAFLRNSYNSYTDKEILFDDETFNGVAVEFEFHNLTPFYNSKNQKILSRTIVLENTTEALYKYLNTEAAHIWQQQSITQIPGQVSSNIPNGYGVIGAYTATTVTINYP